MTVPGGPRASATAPVAPPFTAATQAKIVHCDCDCFYASVEMRDDPALRGRPLAVGGRAESRGVVATCNYEARRFGIHSAMSSATAMRLCPELVFVPPAMEKYREVSRQIMAIYRDFSDKVEPLSLDEAYLDVTHASHFGNSATLIAREIRQRVASEVGVTVSAGVAPNKFLAKIASDWNKPDGLFVLRPNQVDGFVAALPIGKLIGVGRVTAAKFESLGVRTCGELRAWSMVDLHRHFGSFGQRLYNLCRGIDLREVNPQRERKSISVETTFAADLPDLSACLAQVEPLAEQLQHRIARATAAGAVRSLFVKLRFADFQRTTVECVSRTVEPTLLVDLMTKGFARRGRPVRLLGMGVRLVEGTAPTQAGLFDAVPAEADGQNGTEPAADSPQAGSLT